VTCTSLEPQPMSFTVHSESGLLVPEQRRSLQEQRVVDAQQVPLHVVVSVEVVDRLQSAPLDEGVHEKGSHVHSELVACGHP
jgi:hypothetical protein